MRMSAHEQRSGRAAARSAVRVAYIFANYSFSSAAYRTFEFRQRLAGPKLKKHDARCKKSGTEQLPVRFTVIFLLPSPTMVLFQY